MTKQDQVKASKMFALGYQNHVIHVLSRNALVTHCAFASLFVAGYIAEVCSYPPPVRSADMEYDCMPLIFVCTFADDGDRDERTTLPYPALAMTSR